jgi:catechol 2,3-dioxygenase-like lactoylglutathione lyase family enzyme
LRVSCDNHVGVRTNDIDAAIQFWCGALGGETESTPAVRSSPLLDLVFGEGTRVKIAHVLFPAGGGIELSEFVEPRTELPASRQTLDALMHFALTVDDIDGAVARIVAAGGRVLHDPLRIGDIPDGPQAVNCFSPEGHAFQLLTINYKGAIDLIRSSRVAK